MSHPTRFLNDVTESIGNTAMVQLRTLASDLPARVLVKLESHNPGGSVKDRIGLGMVLDAEERGLITPHESVIVEPTSGNTGVALALVGATRGYHVILAMPESMSIERCKLLRAYGASLVLTPNDKGMKGAVEEAERIAAHTPGAWLAGQFDNPTNPVVHYSTTGPEIHRAVGDARLDAFVAGVGTGGTITGAGCYLKEARPRTLAIAVEPAESPIITQKRSKQELTPGPHLIQGIGANFIPPVLDIDMLDEVVQVDANTAMETARLVARTEGLLVGISSGANIAAALRVASRPEHEGGVVVTVAPSTGERYLTTKLWEKLV